MRCIYALGALATIGCATTPPASAPVEVQPVSFTSSADAVWEAVTLELAARGIALASADRAGGMLITGPVDIPPEADFSKRLELADCGKLGGVQRFPSTVTHTFTIRGDSAATVSVLSAYRSQIQGEVNSHWCLSTGAWERGFIESVLARIESNR